MRASANIAIPLNKSSSGRNPLRKLRATDRARIEAAIEAMIAALDAIDGDPDLEDDDPAEDDGTAECDGTGRAFR